MTSSDYRLIELIRQNKHLYNQRDPDFRNLEKKELTWQAIADAQGSTPEICKRRFRSLRDRFVRERRHRKSELLDGTTPNPIWLKMMFLSEHLRYRKRFTWNQHKRFQTARKGSVSIQNVFTIVPVDSSGTPIPNHPDASASYILVNTAEENSPSVVGLNSTVEEPSEVAEHESPELPAQESPEGVTEVSSDIVEEASSDGAEQASSKSIAGVPSSGVDRQPPEAIKLDHPKIANKIFQSTPKRGLRFRGKKRLGSNAVARTPSKRTKTAEVCSARISGSPQNPARPVTDSSCNAAFCNVVKNYLDKISNPMRLSSTRIKILSMVHDEMYSMK